MILAVVGSRDFTDYDAFEAILGLLSFDELVSGGAAGADRMAEVFAIKHDVKMTVLPPEWDKFPGKTAAFERNKLIVQLADATVCFWDGSSKGTRLTMKLTWEAKKPLMIVRTDMMEASDEV